MTLPPACRAVADAGRRLGLDIEVRTFPQGTRTARDAAEAIGADLGQIVKSIVFIADGEPLLCLVSGSNRASLTALKHLTGAQKVHSASAEQVQEITGFTAGGVPPFGHRTPLPTYFDGDLLGYEIVWAAAGTPDSVFAAAPGALVKACGAVIADLKEV